MRRVHTLPILTLGLFCANARAHDPHELLRLLMDRSDEILLVDIIDDPSTDEDSLNVIAYTLECEIKAVYKGRSKPLSIVNVKVERNEQNHKKDRPRLLRKRSTCVLFLRKADPGAVPTLVSTEQWFSVQSASPTFVAVLERYRDKAKQDKTASDPKTGK